LRGPKVEVKTYLVEGKMRLSDEWRKFRVYVRGVKEEDVKEKVYSDLGGRHKLKRGNIKIERIEEVKEEVEAQPAG